MYSPGFILFAPNFGVLYTSVMFDKIFCLFSSKFYVISSGTV